MRYKIRRSCYLIGAALFGMAAVSGNAYAYAVSGYQALQSEVQALRQELSDLRALVKQQSAAQEDVKSLRQEVKATSSAQSEAVNADTTAHILGKDGVRC